MRRGIIRQGDVLLAPVDILPPGGLPPRAEVILAIGETSGHAHRLTGAVQEWSVGGERYVRVLGSDGWLSHEDHDPVPAQVVSRATTYRVIQQRQLDLSGEWQTVRD